MCFGSLRRFSVAFGVGVVMLPRQLLAQSTPELSVSLAGRLRSSAGLGSDQVALVEVEFTPPNRPSAASIGVAFTGVESELETAPDPEVPLDPLERDEVQAAPPDAPGVARQDHDAPTKSSAIMRAVPFVLTPAYVQRAIDSALSAQGIAAALGRLESLSNRAKSSAILPDTRLRVGRDVDQSLRFMPTTDDPYRYSQLGGVSFVVEGAVTWRLGRLIFASEELSIERLRLAQARERRHVVAVTMSALFAWQTAWRRVVAAGERAGNAAEDLSESALRLDVLTGGWFSAHEPAPDPLEAQKTLTRVHPDPAGSPPAEGTIAPAAVPKLLGPRFFPPEALRVESPAGTRAVSEQQQLERLALSR
jgi:hypothetical protein